MGSGSPLRQIIQELRRRINAGHHQPISRPRAGHVEEMPFGVVDLLEIGFLGRGLDALGQRQHLVVAGHDHDRPELETLGDVHCADGDVVRVDLCVLGHGEGCGPSSCYGVLGPPQLFLGAHENADLGGLIALHEPTPDPFSNTVDLVLRAVDDMNLRVRAVEHRDRPRPTLLVAVDIGDSAGQQPVGVGADLVGRAVVDPEGVRAAAQVDAERLPGEGLEKDALAEVAGEEKAVGSPGGLAREKAQLGDADVLGLVDDDEVEGRLRAFGEAREEVRPGNQATCIEPLTFPGEDRPQRLALLTADAGLAAEARNLAMGVPVADPPGVDDRLSLALDDAWCEGALRDLVGGGAELGSNCIRRGDLD